jgi:hypothetical protein
MPSEEELGRMVRSTAESWQPSHGPDWSNLLMRAGNAGPSTWVLYTAASAALVVILITAFLVGSYFHLGALAPQSVPVNLH